MARYTSKEARTMQSDLLRAKICGYVSENSGTTSPQIGEHLGVNLPKLQYYLRGLLEAGFLHRTGVKSHATYSIGDIQYESKTYEIAPLHITVYRLLDKVPPPREKGKRTKSHPFGGMQSGIQGFNSW